MSAVNDSHNPPEFAAQNDGSAARTWTLLFGLLAAFLLIAALVCGGGIYFAMQRSKWMDVAAVIEAGELEQERVEAERKRQATQERQMEEQRVADEKQRELERQSIDAEEKQRELESRRQQQELENRQAPPRDLAEAVHNLNDTDPHRQTAAIAFLESETFDESQRSKVAYALFRVVSSGTADNKLAAIQCLARWPDSSITTQLAAALDTGDGTTPAKLDLLAKYKDVSTFPKIAALLRSEQYGVKAKDTLLAIGPETAQVVEQYRSSDDATARGYANELLVVFDIDVDTIRAKIVLESLKSQDSRQRKLAVEQLAALKYDENVQPVMVKQLNEILVKTMTEMLLKPLSRLC